MMKFLVMFSLLFIPQILMANMVYLSQVGEERRVVLADDQGQFIKYLTPKSEQAYHPEISSDGRFVAYSIGRIEPGNVSLRIEVLDLENQIREIWTPMDYQYIHAEFSGDGHFLSFSGPRKLANGKSIQNIMRIHLPTERAKPFKSVRSTDQFETRRYTPRYEVIESMIEAYFPAVSSDGAFVVFHETKDSSSKTSPKELWMYDYRFKKKTMVSGQGVHAMVPSLSADDRYVAYAGVINNQWDIFRIDLRDGSLLQITDSPEREFTPIYRRTGEIFFTMLDDSKGFELDIYRISKEEAMGTTFVVNPQPFIAKKGVFEYVPAFSGDTSVRKTIEPSFPSPARSSFAAVTNDTKIFVIGGHQGPEHTYPEDSFLDRLDIYDVLTESWVQGASMPTPRHGFEAIAHEGFIYVFGGFAFSHDHNPKWKSLDSIERYDIFANKWETLPTKLPIPRSSNVIAKVGTKVYLLGGWNSTPKFDGDKEGKFHSQIDVFDLETETVSTLTYQLPDPLRRAFTAVVVQDEVFLLGGISEGASHFDWLDNVTKFNPKTAQFTELDRLPFKTFAPGAGFHGGKLHLFGGMAEGLSYVNTIFTYDLTQKNAEWENLGRYLHESKGFPIVVDHPDGGLGILGGHQYLFPQPGKIIDHPVSTFEWLR